ncbi:MAG: hypothetical protein HYY17_13000 [Planctomycetes bacterium]|nr:hypothetical protein [Planctomycetota bacterium]
MVVEFTNLGIHLYQAEASQQVQNLFLAAERANNQIASEQNRDQAKAAATEQVQDTSKVENDEIQGESRGAHSHDLGEREEEKEPEKKHPPEPPDPTGRGQHIDLTG